MRRGLTYTDAARLLGGGDSALVRALDTALGGVLLLGTGGGSELALSLFDAKSELTRLTERLVGALSDRTEEIGRLDRTERLAAAHAVVVVLAFFDAVRGANLPVRSEIVRLNRREQVAVADGGRADGDTLGELADVLLRSSVPPLSPAHSLAETGQQVRAFYAAAGRRLVTYLEGLAAWEALRERAREELTHSLVDRVPDDALRRWEEYFRRLAGQSPELAFYVDRADHEATRRELAAVSALVSALREGLTTDEARVAEGTRAALARSHRAELDRPVVGTDDATTTVSFPTLREGYVDPDYRMAAAGPTDRLDTEQFWASLPVRDDLGGFFVAFLTDPEAGERPMLLLGQPGAGKSVLSKFVAGLLPEADFLVVRVVLRESPADADLQTQIEHAVRQATGEQLGWPALSRTAGRALRLVVLDGLDELLQATGVGRSQFLREVASFQERERAQERPVAVVVTSRIAVAERALLPPAGVLAVRLEPFRDEQISAWLDVWARHNGPLLASRGLQPLRLPAVLAHRHLAEQPLLLLMLALYDADENSLQREASGLTTQELYERLLGSFALREVIRERRADAGEEAITAAVAQELHRLSVAAVTMFHRGRQWATHAELDQALRALADEEPRQREDFRPPVTAGVDAVGRFFFVHRVQSEAADQELVAVEFLHATFGEYLIARLVLVELTALAAIAEVGAPGRRPRVPGSDLLAEALSFAALTVRATIVDTLRVRLAELEPPRRQTLRSLLVMLFRGVTTGSVDHRIDTYRPVRQSPADREAMYSLNLMLLAAMTGVIGGRELFGLDGDPIDTWRRTALLWYSRCTDEEWRSMTATVKITRTGAPTQRDLVVEVPEADWEPGPIDPLWSVGHDVPEDFEPPFGWGRGPVADSTRTAVFLIDERYDVLAHPETEPLWKGPGLTWSFVVIPRRGAMSAQRVLLELRSASAERDDDRLIAAYDLALTAARMAFSPDDWPGRRNFLILVLRQAAADRVSLAPELLDRIVTVCDDLTESGQIPEVTDRAFRHWVAALRARGRRREL